MSESEIAPVQVYQAGDLIEAQLILQLLADEGIEGRLASFAVQNVIGEVPFQKAVCPIWVHEADAFRAREAIRRHQEASASDDQRRELFCYHCGGDLQEQVAICPACGAGLDWS